VNAVGNVGEVFDLEGSLHPRFRSELVDQDARTGMAFHVLKEERRSAGLQRLEPMAGASFRNAVGNLGDLQDGIHFGFDPLEFAGALQGGEPVSEVVVGHGNQRL
jgi:hypothetical protein